ncbi:MAG: hypothetical protein GY864_15820 [Desulfobacterales bacterium]|nr:hypothetical protein [Desulfobacterales bacterium]
MKKSQDLVDKFLDTFFHLPTLVTIALMSLVIVWQIYEVDFDMGNGFIRLNSNQGNVTLYWHNGCCDLEW